ncbi:baseplate J/gp47 family protein [Cytobacillus oceanisediminis]|uniref:baseplate J/gp47 family protein n=1 Tax=Cytobacillus oceanisediminis TaxID=665099 RepID=UPI001FB51A84|nr:baseplate J/gp47 family protein [Cytobacillus oceanisediminis]UOE58072.1 baseplate J/gp47 family protein [Cytobacillus oceanisediminis]
MKKTFEEMLEDVLTRLRAQGGITETSPGSVARTFAEVILEEFSPFYDELDLAKAMGFVSTAQGAYLDLVAELINCVRLPEESDMDYRARIVNWVSVQQNANLTSLRIQVLQIDGVADVQFKRFTRGTGSFTCYVIPQVYPIENDLLTRVEAIVDEAAAYGMAAEIKTSEYKPVDINLNLIFTSKTTSLEREYIRNRVITNVGAYMKELNMGTSIIINEIVQRVMETSDQILDMEIKELTIADKQYFIKNVVPSKEERFFLRKISVV